MSSMQDYLVGKLHDHMLRTTPYTQPTSVWLALFTTKPAKDGTGGTEVATAGTGYGRVQCGPLDANWDVPDATGKSISLVDFVFGAPILDWGTITAMGIADAETSGNFLFVEDLQQAGNVNSGDLAPKFAAGDLAITWS